MMILQDYKSIHTIESLNRLSLPLFNQQYFIIQLTGVPFVMCFLRKFFESFKSHVTLVVGRVDNNMGALVDALCKLLQYGLGSITSKCRTIYFLVFPKSYQFNIVRRKCFANNLYLPPIVDGSMRQNSSMLQ